MMKKIVAIIITIALITLLMPISVSANDSKVTINPAGSSSINACIINVPQISTSTSKFPDVMLNIRFMDSGRSPLTNLVNSDLQVQENSSTPVYVKSMAQGEKSGADFYFVVDTSNHTNPILLKTILNSFTQSMKDGVDTFTIITDENGGYSYVTQNEKSKDKILQQISKLSDEKNPNFYYMFPSVKQAMKEMDSNSAECGRPLFLVMVGGDLVFENISEHGYSYDADFGRTFAKLFFVHTGSGTNLQYKSFAQGLQGEYSDVPSVDQVSELTKLISSLDSFRTTYNVVYRTNSGGSGGHEFNLLYQGQAVNVVGENSYNIQLDKPSMTLSTEDNSILRLATKKTEEGYVFDKEQEFLDFSVDWKGYPREITGAKLIVNNGSPVDVKVEKISESEYRVPWDMGGFDQRGTFSINLQLQITDELSEGLSDRIISGETSVNLINRVPVSLMTTWLLYGLYILFGLLVVSFLIWRKKITASIIKGGKSVGDAIRKTIVGNRNSRKTPVANLEIIDGPQNLIGKRLPVFSDSVTLGRDPSKADLIFYGPDSLTSVSGAHCKLERLSSGWRIIAVSSSRSETFLNDEVIPFLQPVNLYDGASVRMGYLAQQPVEFVFHEENVPYSQTPDPRKTDVERKQDVVVNRPPIVPPNINSDVTKPANELKPPSFPPIEESSGKKSSIFDEYR